MSQDRDDSNPKTRAISSNKFLAIAIAGTLAVAAIFSVVWLAGTANAQEAAKTTIVRDSVLVTGPRTIGKGDFLHVYDAAPYHIMKGHVAMHVPCDDKNNTSLDVFVGITPHLSKITPTLIKPMSTPGKQCLYHIDLMSHKDPQNPLITDVVIKNSGNDDVKLTDTSTIIVGVDEIMPNPAGAAGGGNMTAMMGGGS